MRVVVDLHRCRGYAQCCYARPERFAMRRYEVPFYDPAPPEAKRAQIERAKHACPVRAIEVEPPGLSEEDGR